MQALIFCLIFLFCLLLRKRLYIRKTEEFIHKLRWPLPFLLQPHIITMSVWFLYLAYLSIFMAHLLLKYPWLDPDTTDLPVFSNSSTINMDDYAMPAWLRFFAALAPVFICITYLVTAVHFYLHFPAQRGFDDHLRWYPSFSHDLALQVAALPLVYGVFSLDVVRTSVALMTGELFVNHPEGEEFEVVFKKAAEHLEESYETDFELADLYEAWALFCFAALCFIRVGRQIQLETPTVKYIIQTVKSHFATTSGDDSRESRLMNDLIILDNPQELLFEPLQQTSNIGVRVFVYTYAFKSLYLLGLMIVAEAPFNKQLCGADGLMPSVCTLKNYLDGAALLASSLAIYNIIVFEEKLKKFLGRDRFRPFLKFLGVKILVSFAFFQDFGLRLIMQRFWNLAEPQTRLCYACLMCFEVCPLSVLVLIAWWPERGDWYAGDCRQVVSATGEQSERLGQLAREKDLGDCDEAFLASRQLENMTQPSARALRKDVIATIELHGSVSADQGYALEKLVNAFSENVTAVYRPAALFRLRSSTLTSPGGSNFNLLGAPDGVNDVGVAVGIS